jgi:prophage tail gpP-like protein
MFKKVKITDSQLLNGRLKSQIKRKNAGEFPISSSGRHK